MNEGHGGGGWFVVFLLPIFPVRWFVGKKCRKAQISTSPRYVYTLYIIYIYYRFIQCN